MRRLIACTVLAVLLVTTWTPAAHAGKSTDIALGLASFAVFNQVVGPLLRPQPAAFHRREVVATTVVTQPAVVYQTPVVYATPVAPSPYPTVVQYPHGRYELHFQGQQYVWLWIPNAPPPPPPPAP
ncbi:MAG: hypothetical protein HY728_03615 [Candidatus Rokubacteria bacterium]|nr:hypothetical protein [Candidatus Rokubacteria bacterium]